MNATLETGSVNVGRVAPTDLRRLIFSEFDLLYSVGTLIAGSRAEAKRVLPALMTSAYRRLHMRASAVRTWLMQELLDALGGPTPSDGPHLSGRAHAADPVGGTDLDLRFARAELRFAITTLPRHHREALALGDVARLSYDELAQLWSVDRAEARRRLHQARSALKAQLLGD